MLSQIPYLDEWSALEEAYSSSLLELTQGLQNISSRLPLNGNVKVRYPANPVLYPSLNSSYFSLIIYGWFNRLM